MGKRKSTTEDKAGEMDIDGEESDDVSQIKSKINKKTEEHNHFRTRLTHTHRMPP